MQRVQEFANEFNHEDIRIIVNGQIESSKCEYVDDNNIGPHEEDTIETRKLLFKKSIGSISSPDNSKKLLARLTTKQLETLSEYRLLYHGTSLLETML